MPGRLNATQQLRLDRIARALENARGLLPAGPVPCFAHMHLETPAGERDVLLGTTTRVGQAVSVVNWQDAPLAEVFFAHDEGDTYEVELGDRILSGRLTERSLLTFSSGQLTEVHDGEFTLRREGSTWTAAQHPKRLLVPRPPKIARHRRSPIEVELDPAQRAIVELPLGRSALVLGEAGCGKTTVALHRLAYLKRQSKGPLRSAVIVPTPALARLIALLLPRIGVTDAEVFVYDDWAQKQARRAFTGLPRFRSQANLGGVIRLKRDPALRVAIEELAHRTPHRKTKGAPKPRALARREDLLLLFGDRRLLEMVRLRSGQGITEGMIRDTLEHAKVQFTERAEVEHAHVLREYLEAVDGRSLDEGTPTEDAGTIDVEDYAVLFELDRLRAESAGVSPRTPRQYDVLVVDEAQELAPLELALIGRSLSKKGTLVVAGDAEQQVDPTSAFAGWNAVMADLGVRDFQRAELAISYRCPPDVLALARRIRYGGAAPAQDAKARSLAHAELGNECHLVAWGIDELRALQDSDPHATVAFIARTEEAARRLARNVDRGVPARLALEGDFDFDAGTHVTCVPEVKGLEFDFVVVPDASASSYPPTDAARRALYVAVTRATHQLVLASVGPPSPMLPTSSGSATA